MPEWLTIRGVHRTSMVIAIILCFVSSPRCWAVDPVPVIQENLRPNKITLVVGKSIIIKNAVPIKRVSVAAPEIANFVLLSPTQIYLTGKSSGSTNVTLWEDHRISAVYDLDVAPDFSQLRETLHKILPDETNLRVTAAHDSITLSGTISSTANLSQALALASAYAPNEKIINLVQVAGVHQVMLDVRVAEMSRSVMKRMGVNFTVVKSENEFAGSLIGNLIDLVPPGSGNLATPGAPFGVFVGPSVNALFRFLDDETSWTGFVDALKEDGLVKILAEPTLISLSGQTASFLAGGEFPVPVPQGLGTVGIEYKAFGVGLNFTPTVLSDQKISMKVTPEVSELDFSTAVLLEGFVVPGVTVRRASTVIELGDGQSFAIAGLLRDNARQIISKFPLLGDIPILGALFRSSSFQRNETELIIIVTPHLVKPLDMAKQSLPTDGYIEPDDVEFFLLGMFEGRKKTNPSGTSSSLTYLDSRGGLEGEFGHTLP
jgi:pilus assembly protein CpaC